MEKEIIIDIFYFLDWCFAKKALQGRPYIQDIISQKNSTRNVLHVRHYYLGIGNLQWESN